MIISPILHVSLIKGGILSPRLSASSSNDRLIRSAALSKMKTARNVMIFSVELQMLRLEPGEPERRKDDGNQIYARYSGLGFLPHCVH